MFPASGGSMRSDRVQLELVLRRALRRAGIVTGWLHKCRRQGCGHVEAAQGDQLRRCRIASPHAGSRRSRRAGNPASHRSPLNDRDVRASGSDYLRAQIDRLSFGPARAASVPTVSNVKHPGSTISPPFAPILLPEAENPGKADLLRDQETESSRALECGRGERIRTSDILLPNRRTGHRRRSQPFTTV